MPQAEHTAEHIWTRITSSEPPTHKAKHHKVCFVQKVLFAVDSQDKPGVLSRLLNKMKLPAVVAGARVRSPSNFLACEGEQPV